MSAESFSEAMEQFFRTMRRARSKTEDLEGTGLSLPQFILLAPLADGEERSVSVLAESAGVASPTATRMLDGLVRDGIVERHPSQTDRRCVLVALTAQGRETLDASYARIRARRRALYAQLEPDEREDAERILRRLAEIGAAAIVTP